jgi:hypothetical protein
MIITGIEEMTTRGDLLERSLILHLPAIPEVKRLTEEDYYCAVDAARPRILGALLDAVAGAMATLPSVRLDRLPRMADFARWATAAEPALGWHPGSFITAYRAALNEANDLALDHPAVPVLVRLLEQWPTWDGTPRDLLENLTRLVGDQVAGSKTWPKTPRALTGLLRRLAPNLRRAGVHVEHGRRPGGKRERYVRITTPQKEGENDRPTPSHRPGGGAELQVNTGNPCEEGRDADCPSSGMVSSPPGPVPSPPGTVRDGRDGLFPTLSSGEREVIDL